MFRTRLIAPYQHTGVRWLAEREVGEHAGGFLCDEMGLGKTVQMLATMCINQRQKTLVIAPKSVVSQWGQETRRFVPTFKVHVYDGPKRQLPVFTANESWVVVAPYSVLVQRKGKPASPLLSIGWDRVILDEAHEIRNRASGVHRACLALRARIRWCLSGTPIFNSMKDFVALGAFLGFTKSEVQGFTDEIRTKYILRRTKHDVSEFNKRLELPPCDFQNVELEMYPEERALYEDAFGNGREVVQSIAASTNQNLYNMQLLEALLRVRQVMAWPQMYLDGIARKQESEPEEWTGRSRKMETIMEMIQSHPKEKALVFCQFIGEMDRIQELLHDAQIPVYRIDGSVDKEQREARIEAFKAVTYGRQPVFLIQIKSGGVGLNLQQATRVYITSPAWNPATELQAIARAHRTGQTQKVTVRKLIYTGEEGGVTPDGRIRQALPSVEESILALQETKTKVCAEVLNDSRVLAQMPLTNPKVTIHALKKIFRV